MIEVILRNGEVLDLHQMETILNQSRLQVFMDCPRKYYWIFEENLATDRPSMNLEIGQGVHEGLAQLGAGKPLDDAVELALARFMQDQPKRRLPGDDEAIEEGKFIVENLLRSYVNHWTEVNLWKPLGQEVAGTVEVGEGTGVFLRFRTDKLVFFNRQLVIVDHKTMGKLDMREILKYQMDIQPTAYIYGTMKILNQRVYGVIIDALVKTKIPQFHREYYQRSDDDLLDFEVEFVEWVDRIRYCQARGKAMGKDPFLAWPKNTKECFRFGTCAYRPKCIEPRNPGINASFVKRKPDYVDTGDFKSPPPSGDAPDNQG